MDVRRPDTPDYLRRSISNLDGVVIMTTFAFMVLMLLVFRLMNYGDLIILNLLQSIDIFMDDRDWKKSSVNMFFGIMYLTATCELSLHLAFPCISCIVVSWIVTFHNLGYPHVSWIFLACILIWGSKFIFKSAPAVFVVVSVLKTGIMFVYKEKSSLEDFFFICAFIALIFSFVVERYTFHCIIWSYGLLFTWMWMKSS